MEKWRKYWINRRVKEKMVANVASSEKPLMIVIILMCGMLCGFTLFEVCATHLSVCNESVCLESKRDSFFFRADRHEAYIFLYCITNQRYEASEVIDKVDNSTAK